jgi:phosphoserine aminotransferase
MSLISFYPGPSRVYSNITEYFIDAQNEGILSVNHRSDTFMEMYATTIALMKKKLLIPETYGVFFVSSATECWEIIAQSLTRAKSQHFFNGAFGEKWASTVSKLKVETNKVPFEINQALPVDKADLKADLWCITHNETSNGSAVSDQLINEFSEIATFDNLIAVDATSSMGGIHLPFEKADVWFASVQKCFGLPAGQAVLILSPKAMQRALEIGDRNHYNCVLSIIENGSKNQTHFTPNVLAIYLMYRTMAVSKGILHIHQKIEERYNLWIKTIEELDDLNWLVSSDQLRSKTVLTLIHHQPNELKHHASEANFILGNGYGQWKDSTIRIANFPAIKSKEVEKLMKFLKERLS